MSMKPSQDDADRPQRGQATDEPDFEQALAAVERSLQQLKDRHAQIQRDQRLQADLEQRQEQLNQHLRRSPSPELKADLQHIQDQLDELEVRLESSLFKWSDLAEPFWQIIRFTGLGMVIGWLLALAVLHSPPPPTNPAAAPEQASPR